jgi:phosphatidate cytidylyltransferase
MLKLRVLTVVVVLPLFLAALFLLPNVWWSAAMLALLLVAAHEWSRLCGYGRASEAVFLAVLVLACASLWVLGSGTQSPTGGAPAIGDRVAFAFALGFWCVIAPCWLWLKLAVRHRLVLGLTGLVVLVPTWLALARLQNDPLLLLLLLAVVWIADTAAYFTGRRLGRRKLAPAISPGKTWEGVGGAFAAVAVYAAILHFCGRTPVDLATIVLAFLAMTALSIVGDLFESWLKRQAGVKDSGSIFPGHGGMLDRIDGITGALPVAALIFI